MTSTVVFKRQARDELHTSIRWYEAQRAGLGQRFALAVAEAIQAVANSPARGAVVFANVRRVRVKRFPYFVYYAAGDSRLIVFAIFHFRRDPSSWRK